jgi:hypothetical protein
MRYARLCALASVLLTLAAMAALADARGRVVINGDFFYKPHEFPVSGDGDFLVRALRWRSWGGKTALATGQAVEQVRSSHADHTYPAQVTLSHRAFCANLHRTVYNKIVAQILGPNPGVFGGRTLGRVYTCAGTYRLISPPPRPTSRSRRVVTGHACSTRGMPIAVQSISARDCPRAHTVVRAWFQRLKAPGGNRCLVPDGSSRPATCTVGSWRCTTVHTVNGQTYPVTCTADRGRHRVHFVNRV